MLCRAGRRANANGAVVRASPCQAHVRSGLGGCSLRPRSRPTPGRGRRRPGRSSVLLALGGAHRSAEAEESARHAFLQAAQLARHRRDAQTLARSALGAFGRGTHGVSTWIGGDERVELLEEALAWLGHEDGELRVRVMSALSVAYLLSEADRSRRDLLAAEAVASAQRLGRPDVLAGALAAGRIALWSPEHARARLAHTDGVVTATAATGDVDQELRARLARVTDHFELGERTAGIAELEASRTLSDRLGQPYWSWRVRAWDTIVALVDGRFHEAESLAETALAVRADASDTHALQCFGIQLTCLRLAQGRSGEVIPLLRSAAERYPMLPTYRAALALCYAETAQEAEASAEFERFTADGFSTPPPDSNWSTGMACLAEVCAYLGDAASAEQLHEMFLPVSERMIVLDAFGGGGDYWGSAAQLVGLLEATMHRFSDAERTLEAALRAERSFGALPWVARTQRALASILRRRGAGGAARAAALLAEAIATEQQLGIIR